MALKNLFTILYFMFVAFEDESRGLRADARRSGSTGQEGHQVAFRNDQTKCFWKCPFRCYKVRSKLPRLTLIKYGGRRIGIEGALYEERQTTGGRSISPVGLSTIFFVIHGCLTFLVVGFFLNRQ